MRHFGYHSYTFCSCILVFVSIWLPLTPVFASELASLPEPAPETQTTPPEPVTEPPQSEIESVVEDVAPIEDAGTMEDVSEEIETEANTPIEQAESEPSDPEPLTSQQSEEAVPTAEPAQTEDTAVEENSATTSVPEQEFATTTEPAAEEMPEQSQPDSAETASSTPASAAGDITDEQTTASTTAPVVADETSNDPKTESSTPAIEADESTDGDVSVPTEAINVVTNDENRFSFAKNECAAIGDGTFYCTTAQEEPTAHFSDRIFAAPDADGDTEIFMEKDGAVTPLTENTMDDEAPFYDDVSNTIVWHRLVDGRYQIISYDAETEEEEQLTNGRNNSMQPSRYGEAIVWQGWIGDDWEIFLLVDDEERMLTDNTTHDIMPSVSGTHIVWQSFENNAWHMKVYDIRTETIETVEATEGGSIQNPRFVLVYDTKFESGDIETKGYDLISGEVVDLGSEPAPIPRDIPDPEQTGEERALVSPPQQPKTKVDDETDDVPGTADTGDDTDDIVVPPIDISLESDDATTTLDAVADVVVPALPAESATTTAHIEEIVIPPYTESPAPESHSQETIAAES